MIGKLRRGSGSSFICSAWNSCGPTRQSSSSNPAFRSSDMLYSAIEFRGTITSPQVCLRPTQNSKHSRGNENHIPSALASDNADQGATVRSRSTSKQSVRLSLHSRITETNRALWCRAGVGRGTGSHSQRNRTRRTSDQASPRARCWALEPIPVQAASAAVRSTCVMMRQVGMLSTSSTRGRAVQSVAVGNMIL